MTTIHHVNVMVDDLAAATEFYRDVIGLSLAPTQCGAIDVTAWGLAQRIGSGVMQLFVRDPAGNLIELNSQPWERFEERFFALESVDPASPR